MLGFPLLFAASQAGAADCRAPTTISEAIAAKHEFVLRAKVYRVRPPLADSHIVPVMFSLIRAYRGAPSQILTVYFDPTGDARELSFHTGDVFLISTQPAGAKPEPHSIGNACTLRQFVGVTR